MFLSVINPLGQAASLDLVRLPVWRLEMRAMQYSGGPTAGLALGIAYSPDGVTGAFATIACLDCKVPGEDVKPIAALGFPRGDRLGDKERLREALKVLHNSLPSGKEAEEVGARSVKLVDFYHDILNACWGFKGPLQAISANGAKGELDGWRWALTPHRFDSWLVEAGAGQALGLGVAPGVPAKPVDVNNPPPPPAMSMAPAPGTDDDLTPPNPLGPAPGTETKGKRKSKP